MTKCNEKSKAGFKKTSGHLPPVGATFHKLTIICLRCGFEREGEVASANAAGSTVVQSCDRCKDLPVTAVPRSAWEALGRPTGWTTSKRIESFMVPADSSGAEVDVDRFNSRRCSVCNDYLGKDAEDPHYRRLTLPGGRLVCGFCASVVVPVQGGPKKERISLTDTQLVGAWSAFSEDITARFSHITWELARYRSRRAKHMRGAVEQVYRDGNSRPKKLAKLGDDVVREHVLSRVLELISPAAVIADEYKATEHMVFWHGDKILTIFNDPDVLPAWEAWFMNFEDWPVEDWDSSGKAAMRYYLESVTKES